MIPSWDQTGTPQGFDGFFHLHSSTISGSACRIKVRRRASISPRQSLRSRIFASTSWEADSREADSIFPEAFDFIIGTCLVLALPFLDPLIMQFQQPSNRHETIVARGAPHRSVGPPGARERAHRGSAI